MTVNCTGTSPISILGRAAFGVLAAAAMTACGGLEPIEENDTDGGAGVPDDVRAAFEESCAKSGCHDSSRAGGLELQGAALNDLDGASTGNSDLPLVDVGNVAGSYLALKMLDEPTIAQLQDAGALAGEFSVVGSRMPLDGDFENLNNAIILGWIAGASLPGGEGGSTTGMDTTTTDDTTTTGEPPDPSSFELGVYPAIIQPRCSCHNNGGMAGGLAMGSSAAEAYAAIVSVESSATGVNYIEPMDTANSYLLLKMQDMQTSVAGGGGGIMPQGAAMPDPDEVQLVQDWIDMGANP